MRDENITLVFQGEWTVATRANIARTQSSFPGATVVLSSLAAQASKITDCPLVSKVFSDDPGELPPYKFSTNCSANNINRQIVTSRAGLATVKTPYAAKIRSDCFLQTAAVKELYERLLAIDTLSERMIVNSFFTLHPQGIEGFPFHVSDWFQFGPTQQLQQYWDAPLVTADDAVWFEKHLHKPGTRYFARLYKARFAPEQHIAVGYARRKGYWTPRSIDDHDEHVCQESRRFLTTEFVVCSPSTIGLVSGKYRGLSRSPYQLFNCVSSSDWIALYQEDNRLPPALIEYLIDLDDQTPPVSSFARLRAAALFRRIDFILPFVKRLALMPMLGKLLAFYQFICSYGENDVEYRRAHGRRR